MQPGRPSTRKVAQVASLPSGGCSLTGAFEAGSGLRLGEHPGAAGCSDLVEVSSEQAAESLVDRCEQAAGDENPRFGVSVAVCVHDSFFLAAADQVGEERVH